MILRESHSKIEMTNLEIDGSTEKKKRFVYLLSLQITGNGKGKGKKEMKKRKMSARFVFLYALASLLMSNVCVVNGDPDESFGGSRYTT